MQPTPEQQAALDAFRAGGDMVLTAGAGSGKTTTLKMLANAKPTAKGIYVAYNKAIAKEAKRSFQRNVRCGTAHAFARRAVAGPYEKRLRDGRRVPSWDAAKILGIRRAIAIDDKLFQPKTIAALAVETVKRFCLSADPDITTRHVPCPQSLPQDKQPALAAEILPWARKAWADLTRTDGALEMTHDVYLKLWQLSDPKLEVDFILLDEAQDAYPAMAAVFDRQTHAQRVMVGDACQAIYGWRGAVDAMSKFTADHRLTLSQSFRFGPAIADQANRWLDLLDADLRITGSPWIPSRVGKLQISKGQLPDAVLCRTNAKAVETLMYWHKYSVPAALVGGGEKIQKMAEAAQELKERGHTAHPELCGFTSWGQVQDYVREDSGQDLAVFVKLIDEYGPEVVIDAVEKASPEDKARVVISTAHKAKGREWETVRIANDFQRDCDVEDLDRTELMLAYVAVTRAKLLLDPTGFDWVDQNAARQLAHV